MSKFAKPEHKRAARALGFALTRNDEAGWWDFCALISIVLTPRERTALAFMALASLDERDAFAAAEAALFRTRRAAA